ncbi:MAG TPA: YihY/virulence factor BrkB family protein [Pseudonocardiaceae bacterium]
MSSTRLVPETRDADGSGLSGDDALNTLRRYGSWHLARDAFVRFRYGDGFSHARAFGLQLCLAAVPFLIALTGLSAALGQDEGGEVVALTVLDLTPGGSDALVAEVLSGRERVDEAGELALGLGLVTGLFALTTAMAQVERGANRMYGVERDRSALHKYLRAFVLAVTAGAAAIAGFLVMVAGGPFGDAVEQTYHWGGTADALWDWLRWPVGLVLTVTAVAMMFEWAPRRRQPGASWLAYGAAVSVLIWLVATGGLALYIAGSGAFGDTYGPLTAIMALLLWANLTGIALFLGLAFAAQLEAVRAGVPDPVETDRWRPARD